MERKRSLDINKLGSEDADRISGEIGTKVRGICDDAVAKANELLNIYGMKAMMQIAIVGINENKAQEAPKKKKGRPKKAANL
jgi:hypothetical protein